MAQYKLTLLAVEESVCEVQLDYPNGTTEVVKIVAPTTGTAGTFVTAVTKYVTDMITARNTEESAKVARQPSTAVTNLIGQSTVINV